MTKELKDFIGEYIYDNSDVLTAMQGMFLRNITVDHDSDEITFEFTTATVTFFHSKDCCESVVIDDINGDFNDLIGDILLVAEERISENEEGLDYGTETWTFYTFRSLSGSVDVKWHGESNGYYSERVDIKVTEPKQTEEKEN